MPGGLTDTIEYVGLLFGAGLSIAIFSYLLGDNPVYRFALYLFIGALVGYSFGIVIRDVFYQMIFVPLLQNPLVVIIPVVLGLLLMFKGFPKYAYIGNFSTAFLVGVGAAVALAGVLLGTLVSQVNATGQALAPVVWSSLPLGFLDGVLIVVGTVSTLMVFHFASPQPHRAGGFWQPIVRLIRGIGRIFLTVALGVAFSGALTAALSIFIGRTQAVIDVVKALLSQ